MASGELAAAHTPQQKATHLKPIALPTIPMRHSWRRQQKQSDQTVPVAEACRVLVLLQALIAGRESVLDMDIPTWRRRFAARENGFTPAAESEVATHGGLR